jgi:two-component system OmpR family response regulator
MISNDFSDTCHFEAATPMECSTIDREKGRLTKEARRRILVVEDDPETAGQILGSLTTNGYQVDRAVNGNDALSHGRSESYAVMTMDRMLPDLDGIAVMQQLRQDGIATPVLIVSALGEIDDRVRWLRAGGDEYLVKPFVFAELVARVDALARRSAIVMRETVGEVFGGHKATSTHQRKK